MADKQFTSPVIAQDVTEEMVDEAWEIVDGWFQDAKIDWERVWDRLDGMELKDGTYLDLGTDLGSPALRKIQAEIRKIRKAL